MGPQRIAIVGAGLAGLSCARALVTAGFAPVLLDKGRGVGGRLATRRAEGGLQFDHGAPKLNARDRDFAVVLDEAEAAGVLARWQPDPGASDAGPGLVGLPGMSRFARHLARGLEVRTGVTVTGVVREGAGWRILTGDRAEVFDRVILTLPAPQVLRLLDAASPLSADLSSVTMAPCLTLMAAFPGQGPAVDQDRAPHDGDLDLVTLEASKPGRDTGLHTWVAHAGVDFSQHYLERDLPGIADRMLPLLCQRIGRQPEAAVHAVAHRWRYATVDRALGRPFLADPSGTLHVGGDWCLGKAAEDAWQSGRAIATDVLSR